MRGRTKNYPSHIRSMFKNQDPVEYLFILHIHRQLVRRFPKIRIPEGHSGIRDHQTGNQPLFFLGQAQTPIGSHSAGCPGSGGAGAGGCAAGVFALFILEKRQRPSTGGSASIISKFGLKVDWRKRLAFSTSKSCWLITIEPRRGTCATHHEKGNPWQA